MRLPYFVNGELRLSNPQWTVLDTFLSGIRFITVVAGRRFGKTALMLAILVQAALSKNDGVYAYVAPTRDQARRLMWKPLKVVLKPYIKDTNESRMEIELVNGTVLYILSGEGAERIRGLGLDGAVFDEYADIDGYVWPEIVEPALADKQGWAVKGGTPKGYNHFYDDYVLGQDPEQPEYASFQFTTIDGGNVKPEEIERARRTRDPKTFAQEYLASFTVLGGRVYYGFERTLNVRDDLKDTGTDLLVGMDFNVNPMSAAVAVKAGGQLHFIDEIEINDSGTEEMAAELKRRYPNRRIIVYPDPSGAARKTSAPVGQTDFSILRSAGFTVIAPSKAPAIVDRVNCVNGLIANVAGDRRLLVHPRCKSLIKAFEGLTFKDGTSVIDKASGLDHMADAAGYLISYEYPIEKAGFSRVAVVGA